MVGFTQRFVSSGRTRRHDLATSSTVARWELAHRIKVRRNELGVSVDQIAKHLGFTRNFFSAVEHERSMLATDKLEVLLVMLEFDDPERDELLALDEAARQRGWWESKDNLDVLEEAGSRFVGLELGASEIRTFDSMLIPGLLQLPDYCRAIQSTDPGRSKLDIDRMVEIRARRQDEIFIRGPRVTTLLTEAALRQRWGSADLRLLQLQHVLDMAMADRVELRILTFDTSPGILASSSTLVLLSYDSEHLPDLVYQEAIRELGMVTDKDPQYDRLHMAWTYGANEALGHRRSISFVRSLLA